MIIGVKTKKAFIKIINEKLLIYNSSTNKKASFCYDLRESSIQHLVSKDPLIKNQKNSKSLFFNNQDKSRQQFKENIINFIEIDHPYLMKCEFHCKSAQETFDLLQEIKKNLINNNNKFKHK